MGPQLDALEHIALEALLFRQGRVREGQALLQNGNGSDVAKAFKVWSSMCKGIETTQTAKWMCLWAHIESPPDNPHLWLSRGSESPWGMLQEHHHQPPIWNPEAYDGQTLGRLEKYLQTKCLKQLTYIIYIYIYFFIEQSKFTFSYFMMLCYDWRERERERKNLKERLLRSVGAPTLSAETQQVLTGCVQEIPFDQRLRRRFSNHFGEIGCLGWVGWLLGFN